MAGRRWCEVRRDHAWEGRAETLRMGVRGRRMAVRLWPVDQAWWARLRNVELIPGASRSSWEPVKESVTEMRCAV